MEIPHTQAVNLAFAQAQQLATEGRHEFITPEHLLLACLQQTPFQEALLDCFLTPSELIQELTDYLQNQMEHLPDNLEYELELSAQMQEVLHKAYLELRYSSAERLDIPHLLSCLIDLKESWASYLLKKAIGDDELECEFIGVLTSYYEESNDRWNDTENLEEEEEETESTEETIADEASEPWRRLVTCLNDELEHHNPLIGREAELERTIQVLCRKEKNNPLHIGEPGVGKTSLAYGLAACIEAGDVPERLQGFRIYELDLGTLIAGTQYRGEFEKRLKAVMEGIRKEGRAIVYIDEIHNLVGAGQTSGGSMDASNLLKPYLEGGEIRFIGSTTYEEYNRYFARSRGLARRFQQIDVPEPSIEETIRIIEGLKVNYEAYHQVVYDDEVIPFAVKASARYLNDRFLPDKAIDLMDEAGAYRETHPTDTEVQTVDKVLMTDILARLCKVDLLAMQEEETQSLATLENRIRQQIYGQDEAVRQVVEAVQMAKAGLLDEQKPMGSLLFVGPTGVGKTEIAKVLAAELGIALQRFDMSEYTEKHTVAKLIGSPAGYIGYDDGGLLTDAIRKTPHCVLLLDEIEKAHPDVFNILLQVMDYGVLTDNKGRKADCRHLLLILTSNAGAQYAHQASIGFGSQVTAGDAMLKQVKKTFKPEFLNRLSGTVVFHDMDHAMATRILDKKLNQLKEKLTARNVTLTLDPTAHDYLLQLGFTPEYGAREMDRVIASRLNPLLMREILFGSLKTGGCIQVCFEENKLVLKHLNNIPPKSEP